MPQWYLVEKLVAWYSTLSSPHQCKQRMWLMKIFWGRMRTMHMRTDSTFDSYAFSKNGTWGGLKSSNYDTSRLQLAIGQHLYVTAKTIKHWWPTNMHLQAISNTSFFLYNFGPDWRANLISKLKHMRSSPIQAVATTNQNIWETCVFEIGYTFSSVYGK